MGSELPPSPLTSPLSPRSPHNHTLRPHLPPRPALWVDHQVHCPLPLASLTAGQDLGRKGNDEREPSSPLHPPSILPPPPLSSHRPHERPPPQPLAQSPAALPGQEPAVGLRSPPTTEPLNIGGGDGETWGDAPSSGTLVFVLTRKRGCSMGTRKALPRSSRNSPASKQNEAHGEKGEVGGAYRVCCKRQQTT